METPIVLTIAGSDSGGGAGIQADLKTFASLGLHGTSVITCVTAQNPKGVAGVQACRAELVRQQLEAVFAELKPAAVKTGMLYSSALIQVVVDFFKHGSEPPPLIVDPVMAATSGARLLQPRAMKALNGLLPLADLVTPNVQEAGILSGKPIGEVEDLRSAAREIHSRHGCAVLVKGGHLEGMREAVDVFYNGKTEWLVSAPFVKGIATHGTGCAYSAAIAGYLARGCPLLQAVELAKTYITRAISEHLRARGHFILNSFWGDNKERAIS